MKRRAGSISLVLNGVSDVTKDGDVTSAVISGSIMGTPFSGIFRYTEAEFKYEPLMGPDIVEIAEPQFWDGEGNTTPALEEWYDFVDTIFSQTKVVTEKPYKRQLMNSLQLEDKIAKSILKDHGVILDNFAKGASGWWTETAEKAEEREPVQYAKCEIAFGKDHRAILNCDVADSEELQMEGLQKHAGLDAFEGMIFPYSEPHRANFHMGTVSFPIDIIFVGDDGRVTRKVEEIEPGTKGTWGMPHTSVVIEANGGFCKAYGIDVGCEVFELVDEPHEKMAQAQPQSPIIVPPQTYGRWTLQHWDATAQAALYVDQFNAQLDVFVDDPQAGYWGALIKLPGNWLNFMISGMKNTLQLALVQGASDFERVLGLILADDPSLIMSEYPLIAPTIRISDHNTFALVRGEMMDLYGSDAGQPQAPQAPSAPSWKENDIITLMRELKNKDNLIEDFAVQTAIGMGVSGTMDPAEDEVTYLRSLYRMAQAVNPFKVGDKVKIKDGFLDMPAGAVGTIVGHVQEERPGGLWLVKYTNHAGIPESNYFSTDELDALVGTRDTRETYKPDPETAKLYKQYVGKMAQTNALIVLEYSQTAFGDMIKLVQSQDGYQANTPIEETAWYATPEEAKLAAKKQLNGGEKLVWQPYQIKQAQAARIMPVKTHRPLNMVLIDNPEDLDYLVTNPDILEQMLLAAWGIRVESMPKFFRLNKDTFESTLQEQISLLYQHDNTIDAQAILDEVHGQIEGYRKRWAEWNDIRLSGPKTKEDQVQIMLGGSHDIWGPPTTVGDVILTMISREGFGGDLVGRGIAYGTEPFIVEFNVENDRIAGGYILIGWILADRIPFDDYTHKLSLEEIPFKTDLLEAIKQSGVMTDPNPTGLIDDDNPDGQQMLEIVDNMRSPQEEVEDDSPAPNMPPATASKQAQNEFGPFPPSPPDSDARTNAVLNQAVLLEREILRVKNAPGGWRANFEDINDYDRWIEHKSQRLEELKRMLKIAQEIYTPAPRKDINPKQVPPNPTKDRFTTEDTVDVQTENQPMDGKNWEQTFGRDPSGLPNELEDDGAAPTRPSP